MTDIKDLKAIAERCKDHQPLRFMQSYGALYIRNDNGIVFDVHQNRSLPDFMSQNKDYADLVLAANPAAVLELIADIERLKSNVDSLRAGCHSLNGALTNTENARVEAMAELRKAQAECKKLKTENTDLHATLQAAKGEIERLKGENEALRAEAAKWKNESVSDSQTIYSLSCNLAQRTGEVRELAGVVNDLSALTKRFVQRLRKAAPGNDLPEKALDYLKRKGLQGSTMREIVEGRLS